MKTTNWNPQSRVLKIAQALIFAGTVAMLGGCGALMEGLGGLFGLSGDGSSVQAPFVVAAEAPSSQPNALFGAFDRQEEEVALADHEEAGARETEQAIVVDLISGE